MTERKKIIYVGVILSLLMSFYVSLDLTEGINSNADKPKPASQPTPTPSGINFTVINRGHDYSTPNVILTGGGGSGASAVARVSQGVIYQVVLTNAGYGYTSAPDIRISDPSPRAGGAIVIGTWFGAPNPTPSNTPIPTATPTASPNPTPSPAAKKETFTWVSHVVNATVAQELYQMNFTDVAVRYVTEQEVAISKTNLAQYAIDLWLVVNPTLFKGDYAQNDFKATLNLQSKGGVTNFIIDDANWLWYTGYFTTEAKNNFLYAMSTYGDKVLITLQEYDATWITAQGFSFAGLNVDLYTCPNIYHTSFDQNFNSKTLGIYLWCWDWNGTRPQGRDWDSITLTEIHQIYVLAKSCSAERMYVWLADEDNTVEAGMETSSLLNYPNWRITIGSSNQAFLS